MTRKERQQAEIDAATEEYCKAIRVAWETYEKAQKQTFAAYKVHLERIDKKYSKKTSREVSAEAFRARGRR